MIEDRAAMSVPVYLPPTESDGGNAAVAMSRRVTIGRTSEAPKVCFGMDMQLADHAVPRTGSGIVDVPAGKSKKTPKKTKDVNHSAVAVSDDEQLEEQTKVKSPGKKSKRKELDEGIGGAAGGGPTKKKKKKSKQ
jgi:hypothetical protein